MLKSFKNTKVNLKKLKNYFIKNNVSNVKSLMNEIRQSLIEGSTLQEIAKYQDKMVADLINNYIAEVSGNSFIETTNRTTKAGRDNRIFDIMYTILTHESTAHKMFNPGSFETQKRSARIITILKQEGNEYTYDELSKKTSTELENMADAASKANITSVLTQVAFHKQNMTAGKLIGIFANNNTSHAFLSMIDNYSNRQPIYLHLENDFQFDGKKVTNNSNNQLDPLIAFDGYTLISKNIAGFLAASVDAVKDPVLNYMNLNTCTAGVAMLLARLGFDSDSIGLFLTQPAIEELTRKYITANNNGYATVSDIVNEMLAKYEPARIKTLSKTLAQESFSKEHLAKQYQKHNTDFEIRTLLLFEQLSEHAQHLNTLTFLTKFNSVTNAVGPTIADTLVMEERKLKFEELMASDNPPFSSNAIDVIDSNPILNAFYHATVGHGLSQNVDGTWKGSASELMFKEHFPHYTDTFRELLNMLNTVTKAPLDVKIINHLVNFFLLYKMSIDGANQVFKGDSETRSHYILNFPTQFAETVETLNSNNLLLRIINKKARTQKCPVVTLTAKTGGYSTDIQENIKHAWADLMQTNKQLATDLFLYNIYRSGFTFSPKTFLHLASSFVKLNVDHYVDALRDPDYMNEYVQEFTNILMQFLRNYSDSFKLVPRIKTTGVQEKKGALFIDVSKNGNQQVVIKNEDGEKTLAPLIVLDDVLYYTTQWRQTANIAVYLPTTQLGVKNDFIEVDGNADNGATMASVISKNNKKKSNTTKNVKAEPMLPVDNGEREDMQVYNDNQLVKSNKKFDTLLNNSLVNLAQNQQLTQKQYDTVKSLESTAPEGYHNKKAIEYIMHLYKQIKNPTQSLEQFREKFIKECEKICK